MDFFHHFNLRFDIFGFRSFSNCHYYFVDLRFLYIIWWSILFVGLQPKRVKLFNNHIEILIGFDPLSLSCDSWEIRNRAFTMFLRYYEKAPIYRKQNHSNCIATQFFVNFFGLSQHKVILYGS